MVKQIGSKEFGNYIMKLINKEDLSSQEAEIAFMSILNNEQTDMQQGAFLSALTAKGASIKEKAACWNAIYHVDTVKPEFSKDYSFADNSGTGMDTFKTFNISTAASIIAAAGGVTMAKHGSRAITSVCGTVDLLETLGIDMESGSDVVVKSIESTGIGIFNGTSSKIHPTALGRILSQISFGTVLNISASLANPALPKFAVRGVYSKDMLKPVCQLMKEIGYQRCMIINGQIENSFQVMDEASTLGITYVSELCEDGQIKEYSFSPEDVGLRYGIEYELSPLKSREEEAARFVTLIRGKDKSSRRDIVVLNSGLIFQVMGITDSLKDGVDLSIDILNNGKAYDKLEQWIMAQSTDAKESANTFDRYVGRCI